LLHPHHSIRGANPQSIPHIVYKTADIIAPKRNLIRMIENFEALSIESRQSPLGRNPQIPIPRLRNAMHAALRKPLFRRPRLLTQIPQILRTANTHAEQHRATGSHSPHTRIQIEERT
jgi:hypothetical protein